MTRCRNMITRLGKYTGLAMVLTLLVLPMNAFGAKKEGWYVENGKYYYTYESGTQAKGMRKIDGLTYYLDETGAMQTGWIWYDNNWYFAMPSGELTSGWLTLDGKWYYMRPSGVMVTRGWRTIDGIQYYINEKGAVAINQFIGKNYVNKDGAMDTKYDIKKQAAVKGKKIPTPTTEQYESVAGVLNQLPKVILNYFIENGWTFVCVTDVENFGTITLLDETYTVGARLNGGKKEIEIADDENAVMNILDYYEKQKRITNNYESRLIDAVARWMGEDVGELMETNPGNTRAKAKQYWLVQTARYLDIEERASMKAEDTQLYSLIDEIASAHQLN